MPPIDALKNYAGGLSPQVIDLSHPRFLTILARIILMSSKVPSGEGTISASRRRVPPFMPSHDILRGVIQAIQSTFSYALMLAVMYVWFILLARIFTARTHRTFNGAYIISIVLGLAFGEVLVGRIGRKQGV